MNTGTQQERACCVPDGSWKEVKAMHNRYDINLLIPECLQAVPEVAPDYLELCKERQAVVFTDQDYADLEEIARMHQLPPSDPHVPGITLLLEDLVVPFLIDLAQDSTKCQRMHEIMDWLETLARNEIFDIRNVVGVSICEPLLTTYEEQLPTIYPYLGTETKRLCVMQFSRWILDDTTKQLFAQDL